MIIPTTLKAANVAVILVSTLLVGCVSSRHPHYSEHSQSYRDYHHYDEYREYERQKPEYRQPNYNNRYPNREYEVPQQREQPRYHSEERVRQPQIEPPTERDEPMRPRPRVKAQDDSSTPSVRTRNAEQSSPSQIPTPPPEIIKTPPAPPAQPCSRRVGCDDSSSTHTDSSRRER